MRGVESTVRHGKNFSRRKYGQERIGFVSTGPGTSITFVGIGDLARTELRNTMRPEFLL
jgi:hypothetical protein